MRFHRIQVSFSKRYCAKLNIRIPSQWLRSGESSCIQRFPEQAVCDLWGYIPPLLHRSELVESLVLFLRMLMESACLGPELSREVQKAPFIKKTQSRRERCVTVHDAYLQWLVDLQ